MNRASNLTDSHLHLAEEGFPGSYGDFGSLKAFVSCTASPDEWMRQTRMRSPSSILCYGIHPWHVSRWCQDAERGLRELVAHGSNHIGEIGLDAEKGALAMQMQAFVTQLKIASDLDKVATIHMFGTERKVLDCIRKYGCRTILHSFSSEGYARPFADAGAMFSINPKAMARSNKRMVRLLDSIPDDRLLLESDAPHQGRYFTDMEGFVAKVAGYKEMDPQGLADLVCRNLEGLF